MLNTLKNQHLKYFVNFEDGFTLQFIKWLIVHPDIAQAALWLGFLIQICFILAFITKKYDRSLFLFLLIFIVSDYLFMRIEYWEFIVFSPLFLYSRNKKAVLS